MIQPRTSYTASTGLRACTASCTRYPTDFCNNTWKKHTVQLSTTDASSMGDLLHHQSRRSAPLVRSNFFSSASLGAGGSKKFTSLVTLATASKPHLAAHCSLTPQFRGVSLDSECVPNGLRCRSPPGCRSSTRRCLPSPPLPRSGIERLLLDSVETVRKG